MLQKWSKIRIGSKEEEKNIYMCVCVSINHRYFIFIAVRVRRFMIIEAVIKLLDYCRIC
jgi:hypothetical protein